MIIKHKVLLVSQDKPLFVTQLLFLLKKQKRNIRKTNISLCVIARARSPGAHTTKVQIILR
jgi:hypothetical protein